MATLTSDLPYLRRPEDDEDQFPATRIGSPVASLPHPASDTAPLIGISAPKLNTPKMQAPQMERPKTNLDLDTMAHQQELGRLNQYGVGEQGAPIHQIRSPFLRTLARIGDVAGSIVAPGAMAAIPGTSLHHQALVNREENAIGQNAKLGETQARTAHEQAQAEELPAQADEERARAEALRNPPEKNKLYNVPPGHSVVDSSGKVVYTAPAETSQPKAAYEKGADGAVYALHPQQDGTTRKELVIPGNAETKHPQLSAEDRGFMKAAGGDPDKEETWTPEVMNKFQAIKHPREPEGDKGTWVLEEDSEGKPVKMNTKTGELRPAGNVQRPGTHSKQAAVTEPIQGDLAYADTYMKSGKYTGSGDEAMLEKFFDLAKPSSGFRMTQPQIEMLMHTRDLVQGLAARARHALTPEAPYFSDQQRQQIYETMKNLAQSKLGVHGGENTLPGGITLDEVNAEVERLKKARK